MGRPYGQQWRIEVAEDPVTSTEENDGPKFSIFPNPARNSLTISPISSEEMIGEVTLLDMFSRVIYWESVLKDEESLVLDTRNLASGIYFLQVRGGVNEFVTKVVIEK